MNRDRLARIEELFFEALDRPPDERDAFLDRACGEDGELRRRIAELIAADPGSDEILDPLADQVRAASALEIETAARPRFQLGPYRAEEAVGRGGMGVVYRASRVDGAFEQQVALKLLHLDMQTGEMQARFVAERQLLARLEHRNIARLLDGGVTAEGRPYFVMELVAGRPITQYCRQEGLTLQQTLRLFLQVIDAVSYLHRNLVVHRDLKPSNLLVRRDGVVKLLDFGIAKLLAEEVDSPLTVTGGQLLTPQYAAPEQLAGGAVTTATDVYGLGALLYELLSGRRPRDVDGEGAARADDEVRMSPGQALARAGQDATGTDRPGWHRLPRDLDTICLKALRSDPDRRYASAEQLGRDLEHLLEGRPVSARGDSLAYRLGRQARRHWKGVAAVASIMIVLGLFLVRERGLRNRAEEAALRAEAVSEFLVDLVSSVNPARAQGSEVSVIEVLDRAEAKLGEDAAFAGRPAVEAEVRLVLGRTYRALGRVPEAAAQLESAFELAGGFKDPNPTALAAAQAIAAAGRVDRARREELIRWVIAERRSSLGPLHPDTLNARSVLARTFELQRRWPEAESLNREILDAWMRSHGAEHPGTLKAANRLAAVLYDTARYAEAASLYEEALRRSRLVRGPSHPDTLRLIANLGATYAKLGRYGEAEPLQREVVAEHLRVLGEDHHRTGMSMHNLGVLLIHKGRLSEAETWLRRACEAREVVGPDGYLFTRSFLADVVRDLGRLDEAEAIYQRTLGAQRRELDSGNPDTYRTVSGLAELQRRRGRLLEALDMAAGVLPGQLEATGEKRLFAADTLVVMARTRADLGQVDQALADAGRARRIRLELLGPDHPEVLRAGLVIAAIQCDGAQAATARRSLDDLIPQLEASLGPDHPSLEAGRELRSGCGR